MKVTPRNPAGSAPSVPYAAAVSGDPASPDSETDASPTPASAVRPRAAPTGQRTRAFGEPEPVPGSVSESVSVAESAPVPGPANAAVTVPLSTPQAPATLVLAAKRLAARKAATPSLARPSRSDATAGTVRDVIAEHALGHYSEGLRQHLAIELGNPEAAHLAFARLQERVAEVGVDALVAAPGIRARLYRLAREVAAAPMRSQPPTTPIPSNPATRPR